MLTADIDTCGISSLDVYCGCGCLIGEVERACLARASGYGLGAVEACSMWTPMSKAYETSDETYRQLLSFYKDYLSE